MHEMDVVIVSYAKNKNCWDLTYECINSLLASEEEIKFNVIVVESQDDVEWEQIFLNTVTVRPKQPYGYHKFLNFGRKQGTSDWVALCNNDLIFHKKWATRIIQAHHYNPSYLSFSPICPKTQPLYGIQPNTGVIKGYDIRKHVSGWCIVQRREIYEKIGDLDETFTHWFCDNDYATTLNFLGIKHMLVTTSIVEHHEKTIGKTTENVVESEDQLHKMTYGAEELFSRKWG